MIIKVLLITAALGVGVLLVRERVPGRQQLFRRLAGLLVVALGIVAVLWPAITTEVANVIGVGRGTDLVLYVLVMVFVYTALTTSQRIHHLERQITLLVRELALQRVQEPEPTATPPRVDENEDS